MKASGFVKEAMPEYCEKEWTGELFKFVKENRSVINCNTSQRKFCSKLSLSFSWALLFTESRRVGRKDLIIFGGKTN